MKKIILLQLFLLQFLVVAGQEFAEIGTEWYYNERFAFSGDEDYIKFTSEKDTLVNGIICKKISKRHRIQCFDRPNVEFLYTKNDTVYFFDPVFQEFQILYDFSANVNESWTIKVMDETDDIDTVRTTVDSTSIKNINGVDLKVLYVTIYKNDEYEPMEGKSSIIERIGDMHYMFNWWPWSTIACDANYTRGLQCFQDSKLGLFSTGLADSCNHTFKWVGLEHPSNANIQVYPNPTSELVYINTNTSSSKVAEVIDIHGKVRASIPFESSTEINLSFCNPGVYLLIIRKKHEIVWRTKILRINDS